MSYILGTYGNTEIDDSDKLEFPETQTFPGNVILIYLIYLNTSLKILESNTVSIDNEAELEARPMIHLPARARIISSLSSKELTGLSSPEYHVSGSSLDTHSFDIAELIEKLQYVDYYIFIAQTLKLH